MAPLVLVCFQIEDLVITSVNTAIIFKLVSTINIQGTTVGKDIYMLNTYNTFVQYNWVNVQQTQNYIKVCWKSYIASMLIT